MKYIFLITVVIGLACWLFYKLRNINLVCDLPDFDDVQETINEQLGVD